MDSTRRGPNLTDCAIALQQGSPPDIVLTTYSVLEQKDGKAVAKHRKWSFLILDEAHVYEAMALKPLFIPH